MHFRQGADYRAWEATCPYHKDPNDAPGTRCKKTAKFTEANQTVVLLQLKEWCLAGRMAHTRRVELPDGRRGHLGLPLPRVAAIRDGATLDAALDAALVDGDWIIE